MKKIINNILKIICWILIYLLNFCIMISLDSGTKYVLPLLALISGPVLFLLWRFYEEREFRYAKKERLILRKREFNKIKKQTLDNSSLEESTDPMKQNLEELNRELTELNNLNQEDLNKIKKQELRRKTLDELKKSSDTNIKLGSDNNVKKIVLALLLIIVFVAGFIVFTKYKVEILAKISHYFIKIKTLF